MVASLKDFFSKFSILSDINSLIYYRSYLMVLMNKLPQPTAWVKHMGGGAQGLL